MVPLSSSAATLATAAGGEPAMLRASISMTVSVTEAAKPMQARERAAR